MRVDLSLLSIICAVLLTQQHHDRAPGKNNTDHWHKERMPLKTDDGVDLESSTVSKLMLVNAVGNLTLYSVRCSRLALGGALF